MKRILIIHTNMELGGAETSLLGLLQSMDYSRYAIDLFLFEQKGELLSFIPKEVNILPMQKEYECLALPIKDVLFKKKSIGITIARLLGKIKGNKWPDKTYAIKQYAQRYALSYLPQITDSYDLAISFIDPHYIVEKKVDAKVKVGWLHTDFSRIIVDEVQDKSMWSALDYIVHISDSCKKQFDDRYPELQKKSIVIENILSKSYVERQAEKIEVASQMKGLGYKTLLSIGRFSEQKNFDNVPAICAKLLEWGYRVKWYIIGYGNEEQLIREKIVEAKVEENVIILGKVENPYPYIKACDIYVQPSRYEGKCVAVREAQMLSKPVIITKYETSSSQLEDGVDGVIVPMDNDLCASGIANLLGAPEKMQYLSKQCEQRDYSNQEEIKKIYEMLE